MNHSLKITFCALFASVLFSGCRSTSPSQRFGSVIGLKEDRLEEYKELHASAWPEVLQQLQESNIQNYSIYLTQFDDEKYYLFSYFEYTGSDLDADMKMLAENPMIKKWWALTDPMQAPLEYRNDGEWWKSMEEVFHLD